MDELAAAAYNAWRSEKWRKALNPAMAAASDPDWEHLHPEAKSAWRAAAEAAVLRNAAENAVAASWLPPPGWAAGR